MPANQPDPVEAAALLGTVSEPCLTVTKALDLGAEADLAMDRRKRLLVERGEAIDLGNGHIRTPKDLIWRLEEREVERVGRAMAKKQSLRWHPVEAGSQINGQLTGRMQLANGRFAMVDDGLGFSLVPWNDALERRIGGHVFGVEIAEGGIDWVLERQRGLGR